MYTRGLKVDRIRNCETNEFYHDDFKFLESAIRNNVEKLAIFKTFPKDISLWTNRHTLLLPNISSYAGHVCQDDHHYSITVETADFKMPDWKIPFNIRKTYFKFYPNVNILLEKDSIWLFPLLNDNQNLPHIIGFLNDFSKIRAIDNQYYSKMPYIHAKGQNFKSGEVYKYLETLQNSFQLRNTMDTLINLEYEWPVYVIPVNEAVKCSPVYWKKRAWLVGNEPHCNEIKMDSLQKSQMPMREDILLVITYFNNSTYRSMNYVNALYNRLFKYIVYSGPNEFPPNYKGIFCQYPNYLKHKPGVYSHKCANVFLAMGHKHTKGMLVISEDVLLNIHMISHYPMSNIWVEKWTTEDVRKIEENDVFTPLRKYKTKMLQAFTYLYVTNNIHVRECGEEIERISGNRYGISAGPSFTYYVPYSLSEKFTNLLNYFLSYDLPLDISLPTIAMCMGNSIQTDTEVLYIEDSRMEWQPVTNFYTKLYIYPIKWQLLTKSSPTFKLWQNVFCRIEAYINNVSKNFEILRFIPPIPFNLMNSPVPKTTKKSIIKPKKLS